MTRRPLIRRWLHAAIFPLALSTVPLAHADTPAPYVERYYDRSYQVFVGSGNLVRARQVAENALYWRPDDERWWRRLAEISRWQGDPETSLKAWRQVALRSNDPEAWKQVLVLAPLTYSNRLALRALLKPHKFEQMPRRARPPPRLMRYYVSDEKRGEYSPLVQLRNRRLGLRRRGAGHAAKAMGGE